MKLVAAQRPLTFTEREQVMDDYREDAQHLNGVAGAFFTPAGLARDFAFHVPDGARVLDLCAGIGQLSWAIGFQDESPGPEGAISIVCVEQNPDYARVGRAVLPRATWVEADVFDTAAYEHLGPFDCVIANPPFGRVRTGATVSTSRWGRFEFRLIELASRLAPRGVFIVPQESAPFRYSGNRSMEWTPGVGADFCAQSGINLQPGIGVDTAVYRKEWHGPKIVCEIVVYDRGEV